MLTPYLMLRKGTRNYQFRRAVPTDIREVMGKAEVTKTLGTSDYEKARLHHFQVAHEFEIILLRRFTVASTL